MLVRFMLVGPKKQARKSIITEKETILLGLIAEEPIHAYGLEEKIHIRRMTEWTEIGFSSIYRVLTGLEENGLIEARLEHIGQGATRRVYEINEKGRRALASGVVELLSSMKPLKNPFAVGLSNIIRAPYNEVLETLEKRVSHIEEMVGELNALEQLHLDKLQELKGSEKNIYDRWGWLTVRLFFGHAARHLQTEMEFLKYALQLLRKEGEGAFYEAGS